MLNLSQSLDFSHFLEFTFVAAREVLRKICYMRKHLYRLAFLISIVLWCASVYLLMAKKPTHAIEIDIPNFGAHTAMFFGLAFMTTCSQRQPKVLLILGLLFLFGGLSEVAQHFNPPRTCDIWDFIEDVAGSTLGLIAALIWMRTLKMFLQSAFWHRLRHKKSALPQVST